ncbi:hypothetical protein [Ensifer adhaerens]|uniref:hypothetical protein n=1 Tax=Ensifer adhaerens TaxID=106592 RepID=UPI00132E7699|nr:hypothetical protein [Ensifer adhaerens]QHG74447.1 hypothetical protein DQW09_32180 [Ensifer adhaerens]
MGSKQSFSLRAPLSALVIVIVVAAGTLIATGEPRKVEGESGGNHLRNILYDFQTLITGALAVGAALATIWQMQTSDKLQERRHRQARYDALRNEIVAIKRLSTFLPRAVRDATLDLRGYVNPEQPQNPFGQAVTRVHAMMAIERLQSALQDYRVTSCYPSFPAGVFEAIEDCKQTAEAIIRAGRARDDLDPAKDDMRRDSLFVEFATQRMGFLEIKAEQLSILVAQWTSDYLAEMERLNSEHLML